MSDTNEKKGSFFDRFRKKTEDPALSVTDAEAASVAEDRQDTDPPSGETLSEEVPKEKDTPGDVTGEDIDGEDTAEQEASQPEEKKSWFQRLKSGLSKSSSKLTEGLTSIFTHKKLDDETLQSLEDLLIQADLGVDTAVQITESLAASRYNKEVEVSEIKAALAAEIKKVLDPVAVPLEISGRHSPHIILVVGVNGSGKTTTIGKLAQQQVHTGKKVYMIAGDTFRAAAIEQLQVWGQRTKSTVIAAEPGADSSGLVFEGLEQAQANAADLVLIDTAGRLQNKADLMAELEKLIRVIKKRDESAPHAVLLVLDATTGQNALNQVEIFSQIAGVTGLVMTKLDGTARGGILVAISAKHKIPVHAIGVGEGIDDLKSFDAGEFAEAITLS